MMKIAIYSGAVLATINGALAAPTPSCTLVKTEIPGQTCGSEGSVEVPYPLDTVYGNGDWNSCRQACEADSACLSYSYNIANDQCTTYSFSIGDQSFTAGSTGVKYWSKYCYQTKCVIKNTQCAAKPSSSVYFPIASTTATSSYYPGSTSASEYSNSASSTDSATSSAYSASSSPSDYSVSSSYVPTYSASSSVYDASSTASSIYSATQSSSASETAYETSSASSAYSASETSYSASETTSNVQETASSISFAASSSSASFTSDVTPSSSSTPTPTLSSSASSTAESTSSSSISSSTVDITSSSSATPTPTPSVSSSSADVTSSASSTEIPTSTSATISSTASATPTSCPAPPTETCSSQEATRGSGDIASSTTYNLGWSGAGAHLSTSNSALNDIYTAQTTTISASSFCDAAQQCSNWAVNLGENFYEYYMTVDVHYRLSTHTWECVGYYDQLPTSLAASEIVADTDICYAGTYIGNFLS